MSRVVNNVVISGFLLAALFFFLVELVPLGILIIVLNGIFIGCMVAIAVTYCVLVCTTIVGTRTYDRVKHMALGMVLCWTAYTMGAANSILLRAFDMKIEPHLMVAGHRYIAIIAAVLQVTAPDFGLGFLYGVNRKTLVIGTIAGSITAMVAIYFQIRG